MTSPNNFFQSEGEATYLEVGVVDMLKDQGGCPGLKTQKVCVFNVLQPQQTIPATTSIHPLHEAMEAKQTNQPTAQPHRKRRGGQVSRWKRRRSSLVRFPHNRD